MGKQERIHSILFVAAICLAVGSEIYARRQGVPGPYAGLQSNFAAFTICGGLVIVLAAAETVRQFFWVGAGAVALVLVSETFLKGRFGDQAQLIGISASAGAVAVQVAWALFGGADRVVARLVVVYRFAIFALYAAFAFFTLALTSHDIPTYDLAMLRFDDGLALRVPSVITASMSGYPSFDLLVFMVYSSIVPILAVHDAARRGTGDRTPMLILFLVSAVAGSIVYRIFPVAGPPYLVPDYYASVWPQIHPVINAIINPRVARNCMPSLHTVWALFLLMKLSEHRGWPVRLCFAGLAVLTMIGALTTGKHWFIDVAIAPCFAVAIFALAEGGLPAAVQRRLGVATAGFGITAAWLLLLARAPSLSPPLEWFLIAATIAASIALYRRLRAARGLHLRRFAASTAE